MIKSVIFDLDGTLGNTLPLCISAFRNSIEPLAGKSLSDEEIIATFGPSEEGTIMALIPDHYEQGVKDYITHYTNLHVDYPKPFDGIIEILDFLKSKNIIISMVTGKGLKSAEITLSKFGISNYFQALEAGSASGSRKTQGIKNILEKFKLEPNESIYIGDVSSDIICSRNANVPIVSAAWDSNCDKDSLIKLNPDEIFYTIDAFYCYLKKLFS